MSFARWQIQATETALERLARIYAQNYSIKVIFRHGTCETNGKVITLPSIPENAPPELLKAYEGYLDHEVAHCLFTDFQVVKQALEIGRKHHLLLNAFEDPTVNKKVVHLWRGAKINLSNLNNWALDKLKHSWEKLSAFGKFVVACNLVPHEPGHWFVKEVIEKDRSTTKRLDKVKDLLEEAPHLESTAEGLVLAQKVMKRLQEKDYPPDSTKSKKLAHDKELLSKAQQIIDEVFETQEARSSGTRYAVYSTENDVIEKIEDGDRVGCKKFLEEARQITNALGRKLRLNLASETKTRWAPGKRRGKLDPKRVHRLVTNKERNIFKSLAKNKGFDTAALLLVDHSDSMFPNSIDLAAQTSLIFGENLHELDVSFAIWGYSTGEFGEGVAVKGQATVEEQLLYTRWGSLWIGDYKGFEENWPRVRHRCHQMSRNKKYNTFDGEAVRLAAQRLLLRPEKRKILFVLCDGCPCPNCHEYIDLHADYLRDVVQEIEKKIEVFAIGINHNRVQDFYRNSISVSDLKNLPSTMLSELDRLLRKGQNAYAR